MGVVRSHNFCRMLHIRNLYGESPLILAAVSQYEELGHFMLDLIREKETELVVTEKAIVSNLHSLLERPQRGTSETRSNSFVKI